MIGALGHGPIAAGWWACERVESPPSDDVQFPTWYRTTCSACMTGLAAWVHAGGRWAMGVRFAGGPFNGRVPEGVGFVVARLLLGKETAAPIDAIACPWLGEPPEGLVVSRQSLTIDRD